MRLRGGLLAGLCALAANAAHAAPILVNEYNAVSATSFLDGTASDPYFGRVLGNGGDWVELVVVQDHLDLRGGSLSIEEGQTGERTTTVLTFSQSSLWSDLRAGTIITVAEDLLDDPSYDPFAGDWWIQVQANDLAAGTFITASNFSTSNDDTQIAILDALGGTLFGPTGEGIVAGVGLNAREVFKLEADPSDLIGPTSAAYRDGSSSTFGSANVWSQGANQQDFSALRAPVVPEPGAATLLGVALAALATRACRARRAA